MLNLVGEEEINPSRITSARGNPLIKVSLLKYLHGYERAENIGLFNEQWIRNIEDLFNTDTGGFQNNEKVYEICTKYGQGEKLTNTLKGGLKRGLEMVLHALWVNKAILLPTSYSIPTTKNGPHGESYDSMESTYPEMLSIFRGCHEQYDLTTYLDEKSLKNTNWYAYKLIRATDWYTMEDIDEQDFPKITNKDVLKRCPFTLRQWINAVLAFKPELVLSLDKTSSYATGKSGISGSNDDRFSHLETSGYDQELLSTTKLWIDKINQYIEVKKNRKIKSWKKIQTHCDHIVGWIINYFTSDNLPPTISEFSRVHWDNPENGLLQHLQKDCSEASLQTKLYAIEEFFDYIQAYKELNFTNPIIRKVDYPLVTRRQGTAKKILPEEHFSELLSFTYGLGDLAWYIYEKSKKQSDIGYHNSTKLISTEDIGFVPILWSNKKAIPIKFVPTSLIPLNHRKLKNSKELFHHIPDIHHINIMLIMMETGIRQIHARWLDAGSYRNPTKDVIYKPRDYTVNSFMVNTDKVNGPWNPYAANTAIEILDRQRDYRNSFDEQCLTERIWYDNHENSPYGKILPLFSLGGIARSGQGVGISAPPSSDVVRLKFKMLCYWFFCHIKMASDVDLYGYFSEDFSDLDILHETDADKLLAEFDRTKIELTPHSVRAQVVSNHITILPPSEIKKITGHATEAHVAYYVKLNHKYLDETKEKQFKEVMDEIHDPITIRAENTNSRLRQSFQKDRAATLQDFGATSFSANINARGNESQPSAIKLITEADSDNISFETTHICPFNNSCPDDVLKALNTTAANKPCGGCYYSIKTVDHIPAILGKIRALTDESTELQDYIKHSKEKESAPESCSSAVARRKFLTDEIIAWTVTFQCLENMANDLNTKDNWLVEKPELLREQISKITSKNDSFESLYLKATEANGYAEYFTPALKHQIKLASTKLHAYTGNFKAMLDNSPVEFDLIETFRGQIKSICEFHGISISELPKQLEKTLSTIGASNSPLAMLSNVGGSSNG